MSLPGVNIAYPLTLRLDLDNATVGDWCCLCLGAIMISRDVDDE